MVFLLYCQANEPPDVLLFQVGYRLCAERSAVARALRPEEVERTHGA